MLRERLAAAAGGLWLTAAAAGETTPVYWPGYQLQAEVTAACRESLARGAQRRAAVQTREQWQAWREETLAAVRRAFPAALTARGELRARVVSRHEFADYCVENVLFESLPGWEVNGSVYLPQAPGRYPGVVCPTGHSNKFGASYQQPAQVFARNGYVAISFDPPGCAGEKQPLNDHFTNGLVGYLTGYWSQTHFVADAMACVDYLLTRADVDTAAGLSITGVSGGGMTSLFAAMLDERIAFCAPVCCLAEHESLHLTGQYTSCPEQFGPGYIRAGLDYADYLAALSPRPLLAIGGQQDEVFDHRSTMRLFEQVQRVYAAAGVADRCELYIQPDSGHAYTVTMANEVVRRLNRVIKHTDTPPLPLTGEQVPLADPARLRCQPNTDVNMLTVNRAETERLAALRTTRPLTPDTLRQAMRDLLGLTPGEVALPQVNQRQPPRTSWHLGVEEFDLQPIPGVHLPATLFAHLRDTGRRPALLWLDDRGRWTAFGQGAPLGAALGMFDPAENPNRPRVLSLDVTGLGVLRPEPTAYDLAGWNDIERITTYLAIADARPTMGRRVRDALAALHYLRSRADVDPQRLMVGGCGVGAVVALHAAALDGNPRRVVCVGMLAEYAALTTRFPFTWSPSLVIPNVLQHYDLPEVPAALPGLHWSIINPCDEQQRPLAQETAATVFARAVAAGTSLRCGVDGNAAAAEAATAPWPAASTPQP